MSDIGHNSLASEKLKSLVDRIERLEAEKKELSSDIKDLYTEAKGNGYDAKILRKVVALRRKDRIEFEEEQAMIESYLNALGMLD